MFPDYDFDILDLIHPENAADYDAFAVTEETSGNFDNILDFLPQLATTQR